MYVKDETSHSFKQNLSKKKIDYKYFIKKINNEIESNMFDELNRAN
jgi:hypothetical protein